MNIILFAIPVFLLLIFIEAYYSKIRKLKYYRLNDAIGNLSLGITEQIVHLVCLSGLMSIYNNGYANAPLPVWPKSWIGWSLAFIAVDFQYYWFHRAGHRINLLWASHIVHHQSEEYNLTVALRQGPVQGFFSFWFYMPLALLGMPTEFFVTCFSLNLLYQFWFHTRVIKKLPSIFEFVMNTPSHHRVHHGRNPKYLDKNYAGVFIIWDRLFGSFKSEEDEPVYGTTKLLKSFDPVKATTDYFATLFKQCVSSKELMGSLLVWVKEPGWLPQNLGGFQAPPEVNRGLQFEVYNPILEKHALQKILLSFVLITLISVYFLAISQEIPKTFQWIYGSLLVGSLSVITRKLDGPQ